MRTSLKKNASSITLGLIVFSGFITLTQCKKFDDSSFAPGEQTVITGITANNGGPLYCSISGGCPIEITAMNLSSVSVPYVGPYKCLNAVLSEDQTKISCTVGPAQNGVYKVTIKNKDQFDGTLSPNLPTTANDFTYASFLYLGSQESPGKVYGYAQNPESGALISIPESPFSISGHNSTYGVAIHPNNKFLYAANVGSNTVSVYAINPLTGVLTAVGTPTATGSIEPNGLYFHPSGNYLYVSNYNGNSITVFQVASDGTLTAITGSPFATIGATKINGLIVSADGKYLYAASGGGNGGVVAFTIDSSTGSLTTIAGSPFRNTLGADTTNPGDGITIHPNSRWLYMGLFGIRKMAAWSIDSTTGVLTPIEAPVLNNSTTGYLDNGGSASTVSADGLFLYGTAYSKTLADPKKIIVYSINQTTGGLTRASEVDTGGSPNDVRLDTTGSFAYTCNTVNPPSISSYAVNKTTGQLTALSPRDYAIPTPESGPGIMVMQRNINLDSSEEGVENP